MSGEGRADELHGRVAGAMNRRLVGRLAAAKSRKGVWPSRVLVLLLASVVHATTIGFGIVGLWLVLGGDNWPQRLLGGVCLLVVVAMFPRLPGPDDSAEVVDLDAAPATAALLREVAATVGSPVPTRVLVTDDFNATAARTGLRGRTVTLGAPLWVACSPRARVALLAHELGHFANGDATEGRYVAAAYHALLSWRDIATPTDGGSMWDVPTWPFRALPTAYLHLIDLANGPARRRQELYADLAAVGAAGSAGAVDLLETLLNGDGVIVTCNRVAIADRQPLRPAIEDLMRGYTTERRAAARRGGAAERSRIDDSHPPTVERLRLVESVERTEAAVTLDGDRVAAVDAELSAAVDQALARLAESFRG